jgi:hypothetical protein
VRVAISSLANTMQHVTIPEHGRRAEAPRRVGSSRSTLICGNPMARGRLPIRGRDFTQCLHAGKPLQRTYGCLCAARYGRRGRGVHHSVGSNSVIMGGLGTWQWDSVTAKGTNDSSSITIHARWSLIDRCVTQSLQWGLAIEEEKGYLPTRQCIYCRGRRSKSIRRASHLAFSTVYRDPHRVQ